MDDGAHRESVTSGLAGPQIRSRRLLARLRDVMAGSGPAQDRLNRIVVLIAAEMETEVCSCYVARPGELLELYATVGLNAEAVHLTRLRFGEGLVGEIGATARPLALDNVRSHPSFAYRPETGEDPYQSMLGVPVLRGGRVRGVLAIQSLGRRHYEDEEVETLQTVAMVVAELFAAGDVAAGSSFQRDTTDSAMPVRLVGVPFSGGLAIGRAVAHSMPLTVRQMVADDPARELDRLRAAIASMQGTLDRMLSGGTLAGMTETRDILQAYQMFARDRGWLGRIGEAIDAGLTAEASVQRVQADMAARMAHLTDPYLRERLSDFQDLANRLLLHLSGRESVTELATLPEDTVLVARTIGPAELLDYDRSRLRGLVLEDGGATSHVAIVARALDIPVIGRCRGILDVTEPMDPIVVDADGGQVLVRPSDDVRDTFQEADRNRARKRQRHAADARQPTVSRDGVPVSLHLNAGLLLDMPHLHETGADGVGLYRTEIPFMVRSQFPDVAAQTDLYRRVFEQAGGKPVTFRTLDAGGDKPLPYLRNTETANPALGWRALRIGLDRPAIMRAQLRALLRAADGRAVRIMFPMVASVDEFVTARRLLDREVQRLSEKRLPAPAVLQVGAMIEVPSLVWQLSSLLPQVDFVAVGSNDLAQYVFAADRGDPRMGLRYDVLSPPFLTMLASILRQSEAAGVAVSLCGEMAGRPLEAMALVGIGYRTLSMAAPSVGAVRGMVRSLDVDRLADYIHRLLSTTDGSIRGKLRSFAKDHGIDL